MRIFLSFISLMLLLLFSSCETGKKEVITEKIQYDVNIKSPDSDYDWWIQNLVGPDRERLVDEILAGALSGKYACWDYFNKPLSPADVAAILSDTLILSVIDAQPPYAAHDTTIINTIYPKDIQRLRFLERWEKTAGTLQIEKTIYGIAPIALTFDNEGNERWYPLFWIYIDEAFIQTLKNN